MPKWSDKPNKGWFISKLCSILKNHRMKIDIHVHTKKVKSGDAPTRNIEKDRFVKIINDTEVSILAITNHNHFDAKQFDDFRDGVRNCCQIWPGIELDIFENERKVSFDSYL